MQIPGAIVRLFHRRWGLPIVAELHRTSGLKFITLLNRFGLSRDTLTQTLQDLVEGGWVMRNLGYGHPMRPEYLVTPMAARVGDACQELMREIRASDLEEVALRKWSLPTCLALLAGPQRFSDLKAGLRAPTARAVTQSLRDLQLAGLVGREVEDSYPPRPLYRLTEMGIRIASLVKVLADAPTG